MTRDQIKAILPLLTAFANGETLQESNYDMRTSKESWEDVPDVDFGTVLERPTSWRVKPKPREIYCIEKEPGTLLPFQVGQPHAWDNLPQIHQNLNQGERVVTFREVVG